MAYTPAGVVIADDIVKYAPLEMAQKAWWLHSIPARST